ncbi:MAG: polysaccharide deacetylase family protein [Elusimicrobiota bacterium]|jgi:peptidoglycan/xylan/chitin deacetylase (PgdA/CDA1 family)|nr:polysaccharide deacetylase family protein [Elusimicrobiota bacterium]
MIIIFVIFVSILIAFSLRFTWWLPPKKGLVALMYHNIEDTDDKNAFFINPKIFKKQLEVILDKGFTPINFDQMAETVLHDAPLPAKPVVITLDDGYLNNWTRAFPILKEKNIKANIFLTCDFIGVKKDYLTWEQILEMQGSGLISFGSHTLTHKRLRDLTSDEAKKEIKGSKEFLEKKLNRPIYSFCYPYGSGAFDKRIRPLVLETGYLFDFSTKKGINKLPLSKNKPILRAFPRGGETIFDFYLQLTRGRSKL